MAEALGTLSEATLLETVGPEAPKFLDSEISSQTPPEHGNEGSCAGLVQKIFAFGEEIEVQV